MKKSTWILLRIPFSYFLMPFFCFSLIMIDHNDWFRMISVFIIYHLFLYPASNAFNSYYDRDEGSIGGLKSPPKVDEELLVASLIMDAAAVIYGFFISWQFALALFLYGLLSKAYSYDKIRLKKYPIISWLGTGITQGGLTILLSYCAIQGFQNLMFSIKIWAPVVLGAITLLAVYPLTQVYQHQEDKKHGDLTISMLLGIKGTFVLSWALFILAIPGMFVYFMYFYGIIFGVLFILTQLPSLVYFLTWTIRAWKDDKNADYRSTMRMNIISSTCFNVFLIGMFVFKMIVMSH